MRMAMVGLGKMGANMARRLRRGGIEVVGYNRSPEAARELAEEVGLEPAETLGEVVAKLSPPRVVWLMVPAGGPTAQSVEELADLLEPGDVVVDGGNSNYRDSQHHGELLGRSGIAFADAGTSGGVWGLENGYCLMVGGERETLAVLEPALKALAPAPDRGWAHVGPAGAGHYTKMVHNGIEYGMMQAYAEGLALLKGKTDFDLDLAQVTELWRHGSVVQSWLLDLTADALARDQELAEVPPYVADSGEGRWTAQEGIEQGVPTPVIALALQMRFASQDEFGYPNRLLAMMRNAFGGHA
ncbi:MAG TPA: decarboxylating 6-phosphogluconate dehydrogenase, partial [Gammaproteobacteria bacterium]|nr:decarboxylating 6-phosphogluconate dehydrogenase [Gammaproteobacteria bacterium]